MFMLVMSNSAAFNFAKCTSLKKESVCFRSRLETIEKEVTQKWLLVV